MMSNKKLLIKKVLEHIINLNSKVTLSYLCDEYKVSKSTIYNVIKENSRLSAAIKKENSIANNQIYNILKTKFPYVDIIKEAQIGENLRLDIYIPDFGLAIEWDGEQHFFNIDFSKENDQDQLKKIQANDKRKDELCRLEGINLIRLNPYNHRNFLKDERLLVAIVLNNRNNPTKKTITTTNSTFKEKIKKIRKENSAMQYKKNKERKNVKGNVGTSKK